MIERLVYLTIGVGLGQFVGIQKIVGFFVNLVTVVSQSIH